MDPHHHQQNLVNSIKTACPGASFSISTLVSWLCNDGPTADDDDKLLEEQLSLLLTGQQCADGDCIGKALLISSVALGQPALAHFAVSLLPSTADPGAEFDCFCCWLAASFAGDAIEQRGLNWSQTEFITLLRKAFKRPRNYRTFAIGLQLFRYDKLPIIPLLDFLVSFHLNKEFYKSAQGIKTFQVMLWSLADRKGSDAGSDEQPQQPTLGGWDRTLIEKVSVVLLETSLENTTTSYELTIMLRHLDFAKAQSSFSAPDVKVADFRRLYRLCKCLVETDLELSVLEFLYVDEQSKQYQKLANRVTLKLQERHCFNEATNFASIAGINLHSVIINEWRIRVNAARKESGRVQFWHECLTSLEKAAVPLTRVIHFVSVAIEESDYPLVRIYLLTKKCLYFIQHDASIGMLFETEKKLWKYIILIQSESLLEDSPDMDLIWQALARLAAEDSIPAQKFANKLHVLVKADQVPIVDRLVGQLIAKGYIQTAYRVADLFNYYHNDLALVDFTTTLAHGRPTMTAAVEKLDKNIQHLNMSALMAELKPSKESVVVIIEHICNFTNYSKRTIQRILLLYKASLSLSMEYENLESNEDDIPIIKKLISATNASSGTDSIQLAKELIIFNSIDNETVANIIRDELVHNIRQYTFKSLKETLSSSESNNRFLTLLRILSDPSVLGNKLLDVIKENPEEFSHRTITEFYIKAHDCFTQASDIECISVLLRNLKCFVTQQLAISNDYHSMIRLLAGIGRYSEMTYIFDILRDNHEFEMLLGKGIEKNPQLRIAILDSLKGDKEMYPLVALNFSMHREIAEMLEGDAMRIIKNVQVRQHNLTSFKEMLERSLHDIVDASESYAKANCYNHSTKCAKLAEIIALQVSYLPTGPIIINLKKKQVSEFIASHQKFAEAYIVAEYYNHHDSSWSQALYRNVVERGDFFYLREFRSHIQLTSSHLEEVVNKYLQIKLRDQGQDAAATVNLQKLINQSNDAKVKLRLYRSLGFSGTVAKQFLSDDNNVYLRDVMP